MINSVCFKVILVTIFIVYSLTAHSQKKDFSPKPYNNDTMLLVQCAILENKYHDINNDSAFYYAKLQYTLSQKLNYYLDEAQAMCMMGYNRFFNLETLNLFLKAIEIAESDRSEKNILPEKYFNQIIYSDINSIISTNVKNGHNLRLAILGNLYFNVASFYGYYINYREKQLSYLLKAKSTFELLNANVYLGYVYSSIGDVYILLNKPDSAIFYASKDYNLTTNSKHYSSAVLGIAYLKKGNSEIAKKYLQQALSTNVRDTYPLTIASLALAQLFLNQHQFDSGLNYAAIAYKASQQSGYPNYQQTAAFTIAKLYKLAGKDDSTVKYFDIAYNLNDSIGVRNSNEGYIKNIDEQMQKQQVKNAEQQYKNRIVFFSLSAGLFIFFVIIFLLYRNNRLKQKANTALQEQKQKVEQTLQELKSTQQQLIQSEKMASLGELTAGIAHEIQNPLNFVNNFSEVNKEMIDEATEEINKANYVDVKNILNNIKDNEEKINHHGRRADAIVKGMLQHSRKSSGQKEPADVNALCDEYLRLSYHGLRAKDKSCNSDFKTDFDESIGKIKIVPQDIGRVLINLFNNAFYATREKQKIADENYKPLVSVQTKKINDKIEIRVADNGNGIPQNIIDKIFQPFFTTKPTGQGIGLGLSLAYDIITKEHNGTIRVESNEGRRTVFIICLPG